MKYKYLFIFLLLLSVCQFSKAQTLKLITMNPIHRENQEIHLQYFYTNSEIQNRFESYIENAEAKTLINGTLEINDSTNTNSEITIGPIEINYKGKNIKSDSLKIHVFEKLPDTKYGIWINQVNIDGSEFIVIEQRIPRSMNWKKFATFNLNSFLKFNIDPFEFYQESSSSFASENKIEDNEYTESKTVLLIRNIENLKSDLMIDDSFFNNLPENYKSKRLIILKR